MRYAVAVVMCLIALSGCAAARQPSNATSVLPSHSVNASPSPMGAVAWGVPAGVQGWRLTMADQGGQSELASAATGCNVTFKQNLGAERARAKGVTPESTLSAFRQAVARRTPVSPGPAFKLAFASASSGAIIDFPTLTFAARNAGGIRVVVMADRWFGDVELFVEAECPPTSQGLNGLLDLLQRATVNQ